MNKNDIDDLKSQLDEIQAALASLGHGAGSPKTTGDSGEPADRVDHGVVAAEAEAEAEVAEAVDGDEATTDDEVAAAPESASGRTLRLSRLVPRSRLVRVLIAAVLVLAAAGAGTAFALGRNDRLPKGVAFRVFGHNVSVDQLNSQLDTLAALYGVEAPSDAAKLATFRRDVAKAFAVSMVLDRAAADRDIVIADKQARDVLSRYITQQFGGGSDSYANFVQALGSVGTSESAVLAEIKRQLALSQLYDKVTAGVTVSDADVQAAFTKDHRSLDTPERREIRNIVVATREQAVSVRTKLLAGASFATLARTYSLDGSTKSSGGSLGTVAAADLEQGYAKAAFAAAVGGVFGPVQTQYGWNVGQIVRIVPPAPAVFSKVRAALKEQLQVKGELASWREWLAKQIRNAHVIYSATYRPADPDAAPSSQPGVELPGAGSSSSAPAK